MLSRLRGVGLWFVTGLDDIFVERFWARLRRGQVAAAFRTFPDVILGFWRFALLLLGLVAAVALVVGAG